MDGGVTGMLGNVQENESACPSLSFQQRIMGFIGCLVLGVLCGALSWIAFFNGNLLQFGVFITLSNISTVSGSLFLMGPKKQLKKMFEKTRIIATCVYLGAMLGTLVAAFAIKIAAIVIVFCCIQYLAMIWYGLSYIPFARAAVKNCFKSCVAG